MSGIQAILLAGPTASGKSALALELAERLSGIIVNADSMQVYRDLRVLTARPRMEDLRRAPHGLYGHVDGAINFSAARWREDVSRVLTEAQRTGLLPIIVGGTGLYFKTLERGLANIPLVPEDVRQAVRKAAEGLDTQALHRRLAAVDALTAARLRPTDRHRILRALEVEQATGRPLALWQEDIHSTPLVEAERCIRLFIVPDRSQLYEKINRRFDAMIAAGALEEVAELASRGLDPTLPVMRAHGVPGLLAVLKGQMDLERAVEDAKGDTRHYAKRQFTWFRHQMPGWEAVHPEAAPKLLEERLEALHGRH